ncbi:MAG: MmcQ/YjbR family DNA-binding protein [Polyangiaceae bacterium]
MNKPISPAALERLRTICLVLPETTEKVAWGDPTWRVRDKIFAMQKGNHSGARPSVWLKSTNEAREPLLAGRPKIFFVPPYVGHKGWVGAHLDGRVPWSLLQELIWASYRQIAPKRLIASL